MSAILRPLEERDLSTVVAIYNDILKRTNAVWNDTIADEANRRDWWQGRITAGFPVLIAEADGAVAGYGSFGPFRPHDGYRTSVEHSVHIASESRGKGLGRLVLTALVEEARKLGKHAMVGGIAHDNVASIKLHESLGFTEVGRMPEIATKHGNWQTLVLMQKLL